MSTFSCCCEAVSITEMGFQQLSEKDKAKFLARVKNCQTCKQDKKVKKV